MSYNGNHIVCDCNVIQCDNVIKGYTVCSLFRLAPFTEQYLSFLRVVSWFDGSFLFVTEGYSTV